MNSTSTNRTLNNENSGLKQCRTIIGVASGKGGVGKSTVAAALAAELAHRGQQVGLLDTDIYGPSIPTLFEHHELGLTGDENNMVLPQAIAGIKVMSFGFWLGSSPAIMRGPMVTNYVQQFLHQVAWGPLDMLLIDMPPGTGDVQITITQSVQLDGAIIVTTPHPLSAADVGKAIQMFDRVSVPVLGVIENMSHFTAPDTGKKYHVFGSGAAASISERFGLPTLGRLPISAEHFGGPTASAPRSTDLQDALDATLRRLEQTGDDGGLPDVAHDDLTLTLTWPGREAATVSHKTLRAACQCAVCVDEFTGEQRLNPDDIRDDIAPKTVERVGNYALSILWNDGHSTGFFPYERIRELAATEQFDHHQETQ